MLDCPWYTYSSLWEQISLSFPGMLLYNNTLEVNEKSIPTQDQGQPKVVYMETAPYLGTMSQII